MSNACWTVIGGMVSKPIESESGADWEESGGPVQPYTRSQRVQRTLAIGNCYRCWVHPTGLKLPESEPDEISQGGALRFRAHASTCEPRTLRDTVVAARDVFLFIHGSAI